MFYCPYIQAFLSSFRFVCAVNSFVKILAINSARNNNFSFFGKFLEAEILSQLDALDATIFEIHAATSKVEPGKFTDRQWALDNRKLFNHGRTTTEHKVNLGE